MSTLKYTGEFSKAASSLYTLGLTSLGVFLDVKDVFNLSNELTSTQLKDLMSQYDKKFKEMVQNNIITPDKLLILEVLNLKSQNKIAESLNLLYGGAQKLVDIFDDYYDKNLEQKVSLENNYHIFPSEITEKHLDTLYEKWPIKSSYFIFSSTVLITLSIVFVLTRNIVLFIFLILFCVLNILYLMKSVKWQ